MDRQAAGVWRDPESPAVCLLALGIDRYPETDGTRLLCLNWTPQTWGEEIEASTGQPPHPVCSSRLGAALALLNNPDEYYHSVPGFRDICLGLASDWFDHEVDHHPDSEELIRGVVEAHMLHPPDDSDKFSPTVNRYVNMVLRQEGFAKLPGAFEAFGFHPDPGVDWGADLSTDPDLASLAQAGHDDRHAEFVDAFSSWLLELADRLERLPLHTIKNAKAVADDIRKRVPSVPAE